MEIIIDINRILNNINKIEFDKFDKNYIILCFLIIHNLNKISLFFLPLRKYTKEWECRIVRKLCWGNQLLYLKGLKSSSTQTIIAIICMQ